MAIVLSKAILSFVGRAYLYLRFREKEKVQQELAKKYEGYFQNAGIVLLFDLLMALTVVTVVAVAASILYFVAG